MRKQKAVRARDAAVAQKTKYAWAASVALIAALIMSFFWAVPRAAAQTVSGPTTQSSSDPVSADYQAMVDFYLARGIDLASAEYMAAGQVATEAEQGVLSGSDPASADYQAMLGFYLARGIDLASAEYLAEGQVATDLRYGSLAALSTAPTGAGSGAGTQSEAAFLAANPEVAYARGYTQSLVILAQSSGQKVCSVDVGGSSLSDNPELVYAREFQGC